MKFRPEEYYAASQERIRQASQAHTDKNSNALAIYCGGLAVECLLRAFRWDTDSSFEGRHDLAELFRASGMARKYDALLRKRGDDEAAIDESIRVLRANMETVIRLWHNNLRFASEASLKTHLKRLGQLRGIKGGSASLQRAATPSGRTAGGRNGKGVMGIRETITSALIDVLPDARIRIDRDGNGVSGSVTSHRFEAMTSLERQRLIDATLRAAAGISEQERREIALIAALTPAEADVVGQRVQIARVKERAGGTVEIVVFGPLADAEHLRMTLGTKRDIRTTTPKPVDCAPAVLTSFRATGSKTRPLTREKTLRLLKADQSIDLLPDA